AAACEEGRRHGDMTFVDGKDDHVRIGAFLEADAAAAVMDQCAEAFSPVADVRREFLQRLTLLFLLTFECFARQALTFTLRFLGFTHALALFFSSALALAFRRERSCSPSLGLLVCAPPSLGDRGLAPFDIRPDLRMVRTDAPLDETIGVDTID